MLLYTLLNEVKGVHQSAFMNQALANKPESDAIFWVSVQDKEDIYLKIPSGSNGARHHPGAFDGRGP